MCPKKKLKIPLTMSKNASKPIKKCFKSVKTWRKNLEFLLPLILWFENVLLSLFGSRCYQTNAKWHKTCEMMPRTRFRVTFCTGCLIKIDTHLFQAGGQKVGVVNDLALAVKIHFFLATEFKEKIWVTRLETNSGISEHFLLSQMSNRDSQVNTHRTQCGLEALQFQVFFVQGEKPFFCNKNFKQIKQNYWNGLFLTVYIICRKWEKMSKYKKLLALQELTAF